MKFQRLLTFIKTPSILRDILFVTLLTLPAIFSLFTSAYFTMHDDQHIARLFVFDKALREGDIYPRWVDGLGFGFGYPLFNFYPPLIYYIAEIFHFIGFSLTWSIKILVYIGFISAAIGMYLFTSKMYDRYAGIVASVLYTYFFYHATTVYVRGALAEFFSLSVLPFLFWSFLRLYREKSIKNILISAVCFALLIINHPLIAFPALIFIGFWGLFLLVQTGKLHRKAFASVFAGALIGGLLLSAFFWLPSLIERKYTLVDDILTTELASYAIHFIYPSQFWQSLWGYGGSIAGPNDGLTFQLGKIHMFLAFLGAGITFFMYYTSKKKLLIEKYGMFLCGMLFFSLFMTTEYSKFIWDTVSFLSYLQFPWRFLTFAAVFISALGGSVFYYLFHLEFKLENKLIHITSWGLLLVVVGASIVIYGKYFKPQGYRALTDAELTTKEEISWRISRSSFEFIPQGVITTKSDLNTTIPAIYPHSIPDKPYTLLKGKALVEETDIKTSHKSFILRVGQPVSFRLNTFYFPGWEATLENPDNNEVFELPIQNNNPYRLITVDIPPGEYILTFTFNDTPVRFMGNIITLVSLLFVCGVLFKYNEVNSLLSSHLKKIQ